MEGWEAVAPSATFERGRVAGSTGCNQFSGSYAVDGDALNVGELTQTDMACAPPADDVERAFAEALRRVTGWRVDDDELALLDAGDDEVLRFRVATPAGS